jgi:uncharacterized protein (TIGR02996 family)
VTSDEQALLAAIVAAPGDDTPRLVYADWLDENGHPYRAEGVRVGCELSRLTVGDPATDARAQALIATRDGLAHTNHYWQKEVQARLPPPNRQTSFIVHRGLPCIVSCTVKYFLEHAAAILAAAPVEEVRFRKPSPKGLAGLADVPEFARVSAVQFDADEFRPPHARAFLGLPLGHLRRFDLEGGHGYESDPPADVAERSAETVALIAGSAAMPRLRRLDFRNAGIGDAGGMALAAADGFPHLNHLMLEGNPLSESTRQALRDRYGDRVLFEYTDYRGRITYGEVY